jgi:serine O-acetyltransferase
MHYLFQDTPRYIKPGRSAWSNILFNPPCRFMFTIRGCQYFSKWNPMGFLFRIWNKNLQAKYGYQFQHTCKIGKGFYMPHYGNIIINNKAIIGENCNLAQGVTLGNIKRGKKEGNPTIGDRVVIGANAVVVGKISIGNDVLIAPLSFVNFDVPDRAVVAGNPASVLHFNSSEGYVENQV